MLMMPDYRPDNPYQELLAHGLKAEGCRVAFPRGYRRVLPLCRAVRDEKGVDILHLHWTSPYLKGCGLAEFLVFLAEIPGRPGRGAHGWLPHRLDPAQPRVP